MEVGQEALVLGVRASGKERNIHLVPTSCSKGGNESWFSYLLVAGSRVWSGRLIGHDGRVLAGASTPVACTRPGRRRSGHCPLVVTPGNAYTEVPPGDSFKSNQLLAKERYSWEVSWYFALTFIITLTTVRE